MADPTSGLFIPHLMGITLDTQGVANTYVVATNQSTGTCLVSTPATL